MIGRILRFYLIAVIIWAIVYGVLFSVKGLDDTSRQILYLKVNSQFQVDWDVIKPLSYESPIDAMFEDIERKIERGMK